MNRPVRDPYAGWCERRIPSVIAGGTVYLISASFIFNICLHSLLRFQVDPYHLIIYRVFGNIFQGT